MQNIKVSIIRQLNKNNDISRIAIGVFRENNKLQKNCRQSDSKWKYRSIIHKTRKICQTKLINLNAILYQPNQNRKQGNWQV